MPRGIAKNPEEKSRKLSLALKGRKYSDEYKKHMSEVKKNCTFSPEHRKHLSESKSGKNHHFYGKHQTPEHIAKRVAKCSGEKHYKWTGKSPENKRIRSSLQYKLWRTAVFERDNYTCIWCGARSGNGKAVVLNADHIKPFAFYPELRFAIDNGRTLCKPCHLTTETHGRRKKSKPNHN